MHTQVAQSLGSLHVEPAGSFGWHVQPSQRSLPAQSLSLRHAAHLLAVAQSFALAKPGPHIALLQSLSSLHAAPLDSFDTQTQPSQRSVGAHW